MTTQIAASALFEAAVPGSSLWCQAVHRQASTALFAGLEVLETSLGSLSAPLDAGTAQVACIQVPAGQLRGAPDGAVSDAIGYWLQANPQLHAIALSMDVADTDAMLGALEPALPWKRRRDGTLVLQGSRASKLML